ncbi:MAG TPA: hypothetical protein VEA18_00685, partial [Candidatus Kapabacteria bacterium]|nr:hypothetical protein [Candidatus Kapabacteria bacterium]
EKKGQAKVEWQGIFARIDSKARETLANEVMRAGYENLGDFLKDWEDHLYEPTFEALSRWADQERRNAAAESITFLDKRKIDTLERVKQMAPLAGIAAVGVVGNLFGTVTGVVRPVITTLVGSALGGITGFFREKMKKQYAESKEKIAKENAALVAERERDVAIVETVINRFKELDGRDIAGFVSQAIRSASGVEATTNDREANAELLYLAIKKHQQEEAAKLLETDKENGELIAKDQERRAENLIAQLYSSDHLGHKIHELLELHAKDPFVIELAKKVMALRAGNVAELFKKEEHGDHGEEKKEEGHGSAHAHGHGHGHGGEKSHGKKESGKKGGKGKKGEMTEEEKQDIKNALLGAVFGGGFGLALSAIPEFRAAMGALSGGYLGYRYAQITNVEAREKAFIKDITKYIETAEKKVQKRESVEWGKDSMEELMSLATELRIPLSLGVLGKDTYFGLYMRAKNVLRRIEGLMIAEHLKDASMEQLLGSLDKQNHELHEKREKALEELKKGSITRQVVYGTIGAAVGGVLAYGIADGGRHLNEWFGPEAHDAVPPGGDRMPSAPQERVDVAPPLYQVELPPQETWKPDIFYVGRGEGVSYPIYDDLTAHPDHVKLYVEGNSGSPEANKIQAILERRGGDVNQLNEADLRRIAGLISKHDFGAIDANGDTILGVSTKGIDKVGVYFDPETCKFVMNANPDELYATRIPHGSTSVPEAPAAVQPPESAVPELGERMNTPVKTWTWGGTGMASGQPLQEFTNGAEKLFINETTNLIYNAEGNRIGWFDGNIHRGGSPAGYSGPEKIGPIQTLPEGSFPAPTLKESDATYDVLRQYGMGKGFNEGIAHTLTETAPVQRSAARVVVPETTSRPVG